ncbi:MULTISPECIES: FbpB family small basic protein [Allobacillus]|uniref:FbpB family small basic protein n=1 Tax=Allobacillus halotolerans TaxID=570278 RepID=A0ABS6GJG7_9BACI|nr:MULTISPECIES: FbpB family small basic protein [Allobacillus]MBU6079411.1 FbpB family small basic protein [Allobacillus halotolerans]TSJ69128.1 FbpB family small basic protein [Allobacillus sp. SKP2-8]
MRRNNQVSFQTLIQQEKDRIMKDPKEIDKIYDRLDQKFEVVKQASPHA